MNFSALWTAPFSVRECARSPASEQAYIGSSWTLHRVGDELYLRQMGALFIEKNTRNGVGDYSFGWRSDALPSEQVSIQGPRSRSDES